MEQTRASNYDGLITHFEAHTFDAAGPAMPRYAAVAAEFFDAERVGAKIVLSVTESEAFEFLGESVLDGYAPDGVYDLDTAEKIDVEVSTPMVTRAKLPRRQREPARRVAAGSWPGGACGTKAGPACVKRVVKRTEPDGVEQGSAWAA